MSRQFFKLHGRLNTKRGALPTAMKSHSRIAAMAPLSAVFVSTVVLGSLSGCISQRAPAPSTIGSAPQQSNTTNRAQQSAKAETSERSGDAARSGNAPSFGSWASEVARRVREYPKEKPGGARRVMNTGLPIDVASIAERHPAWQLAQALERGSDLSALSLPTANLAGVSSPDWQTAFGGRSPNWFRSIAQSTLSANSTAASQSFDFYAGSNASQSSGATREGLVLAVGLPALQTRMRQRQENALGAFAGATQQAQQAARQSDLQARLAAMREDIELAREVNLSVVNPLLPEDLIQLEMMNLRLHLQVLATPGNVYATPTEIAATRARLAELNTEWRRELRNQENVRRELLERLRDERPRQIEAQRRREIEIAALMDQERDNTLRVEVAGNARRRIAEDFEAADARLGIVIPSVDSNSTRDNATNGARAFRTRRAERTSEAPQSSRSFNTSNFNLPQMPPLVWPQVESFNNADFDVSIAKLARLTPAERQAQIRRLRALAWSDARQWSRVVALRNADRKRIQESQSTLKPQG